MSEIQIPDVFSSHKAQQSYSTLHPSPPIHPAPPANNHHYLLPSLFAGREEEKTIITLQEGETAIMEEESGQWGTGRWESDEHECQGPKMDVKEEDQKAGFYTVGSDAYQDVLECVTVQASMCERHVT